MSNNNDDFQEYFDYAMDRISAHMGVPRALLEADPIKCDDDIHCYLKMRDQLNDVLIEGNHPDGWYRKFECINHRANKNLRPNNYRNFTRGGKRR